MKRSAAIVATAGLIVAGTLMLTMESVSAAVTGCRAVYTVQSQWPGGFNANVAVTNLGDPITRWVVTWDFGAGQQVVSGWNATWTQSGSHVSVAGPSWGGSLGTGQTVNIGFNGSWSGSNPIPTAIYLNGVLCDGTIHSPSASASATASASSSIVDRPSVVQMTSPVAGQIYGEPGSLLLSANASDPDGTITKVEFFAGFTNGSGTLVATDTTAPYSFTLTVRTASVYYLTAIAYDNAGLTATDTVHISVAVSDPPLTASPTPSPTQ